MAIRPLTFGVRLRDAERGRTLRIRQESDHAGRYVIEDERPEGATRRSHASAADAVREGARIWRHRLH
jgi:hypothetical protein